MDYENVKQFIYKNIRQYNPYRDNEFYQVLISFLEEDYFKTTYVDIPENFRFFFEKHDLAFNLHTIILTSLGFPKDLIKSLPSSHKQILLNKFTNYHNQKGTLKLIKDITSAFDERLDIYELYIDFRNFNNLWDWYFIPKPIYNHSESQLQPIKYDDIYNNTPLYFISKEQIHTQFINKTLVLPIKSNLIYIDMLPEVTTDEMINLVAYCTTFYFKNEIIEINMKNGIFQGSILGLYKLWQYLSIRYRQSDMNIDINESVINYDLDQSMFYYTIEPNLNNSLKPFIDEYYSLVSSLKQFYFNDVVRVNIPEGVPIRIDTLERIRQELIYNIDSNLLEYIDSQILISTNIESETLSLMQEIWDSINRYIDLSDNKLLQLYKQYIAVSFKFTKSNLFKTTTYKLLNLFKPYHTILVYQHDQEVVIEQDYSTKIEHATVYTISDDIKFYQISNGVRVEIE